MTREQIQHFKQLFEEAKRTLSYNNSLMNESFNIIADDLFDLTDLASSELETSMRVRLKSREVMHLQRINEALSRITDGSFGSCEDCCKEIGIGRLLAKPTATLCIECKEEKEHLEQRMGSRSLSSARHFQMM